MRQYCEKPVTPVTIICKQQRHSSACVNQPICYYFVGTIMPIMADISKTVC